MAITNPFTFLQQVRSETAKVTWPSRRETMISTIMVLAMVVIASIFFFTVDQLYGWGFDLVFGPAS
ncbi:preprotein translocase subunit SecE [Oricola sp.]|uniref:preprotein translocase subunit SecE n=1 Tax=Oricola sp. TaxID=1979950 RepID=UPI0025E2D9D6|nr:preprotein translocase subunit SecE [Oricola sp.]MCI5075468.1 preprotein translocase subunit SecE [Oricola sp.]